MKTKVIPGLNIQWPWSEMIASGKKSIETRGYNIPKKYLRTELALIETPGPMGRQNGIEEARIIATFKVVHAFRYKSIKEWQLDKKRHRLAEDNKIFMFKKDKPKWAWVIQEVKLLKKPIPAPTVRGIVFATKCRIK